MKTLLFVASIALTTPALLGPAGAQSTSYINPGPGGSYTISRPFAPGGPMTTWVHPTPNGGYIASTPFAPGGPRTTWINPTIGGGYIVSTPFGDDNDR